MTGSGHKLTVEPDDPPLLKRRKSPCKEGAKFGKLLLLSCVLPAQVHISSEKEASILFSSRVEVDTLKAATGFEKIYRHTNPLKKVIEEKLVWLGFKKKRTRIA